MNEKIIIDTDPGVDDALAIMFAIKYGCNIIGITTVFGNNTIENTTNNALKILSIMKSDIPVYKGESKPLIGKSIIACSHGNDGFGGYNIKSDNKIQNKSAIEFYIEQLEKYDNITIICLGPTTNIAVLNIIRPDLVKKIKKLIILGGVIGENGNISKYAEFNVYNDPNSLEQVMKVDINKYIIPINVCRSVVFTLDEFDNINNGNLSQSIKQISKGYIEYYKNNTDYGVFKGGVMYDLLAIIYFTNNDLFKYKDIYIEVNIDESEKKGEILDINNGYKNCNLITQVDSEKLKTLFFNTLNK